MSDDEDFQRQLELEAAEAAAKAKENTASAAAGAATANPYLYTDPTGTQYEWDHIRRAWIPKIDDDFMARYQAAYGMTQVVENGDGTQKIAEPVAVESGKPVQPSGSRVDDNEEAAKSEDQAIGEDGKEQQIRGKRKKKAEPEKDPEWFDVDDDHNTNVYVSNLPLDASEEDFIGLMSKYGLVMKDMTSGKHKIKMYRDQEGNFKGDALCTYIKVESVHLALQLLDESLFRNNVIRVERAKFTLKGEYDASKKPKKKKQDKKKMKKKMEKLFDWRPDKLPGERNKSEKVVIIKNMFDISDFAQDPKLILEYRSDVREECSEKCGEVKKVDVYDNNPEGVVAVFFADFESADTCVTLMNGRFFAGRKLQAFNWDGKTKYKINESEQEAEKRMKEWDKFLEQTS